MYFYYLIFFLLVSFYFIGKDDKRRNTLFIITAVLLIGVAGLRGSHVDRDYVTYVDYLNDLGGRSLIMLEPTFFLFSYIALITANPPVTLFLIFAIIGVTLKFKAIAELTEFWFLSIVIYFSYYFLVHEMTQVRIGVCSGILLLAVKDIYNKNIRSFLFKVFIGTLFHYSFLIVIIFYFLNPKKINRVFFVLLILFSYVIFYGGVNTISLLKIVPIYFIQVKIDNYLLLMGDGNFVDINVINILMIYRICFMFVLLWKSEFLQTANKYSIIMIKLYSWSLFFLVFLAGMPVMAFRINQLLCIVEIILWPFLLYILKEKYLAVVIVILTALGMMSIELLYNHLVLAYFK
jgi:hypothetical protein